MDRIIDLNRGVLADHRTSGTGVKLIGKVSAARAPYGLDSTRETEEPAAEECKVSQPDSENADQSDANEITDESSANTEVLIDTEGEEALAAPLEVEESAPAAPAEEEVIEDSMIVIPPALSSDAADAAEPAPAEEDLALIETTEMEGLASLPDEPAEADQTCEAEEPCGVLENEEVCEAAKTEEVGATEEVEDAEETEIDEEGKETSDAGEDEKKN